MSTQAQTQDRLQKIMEYLDASTADAEIIVKSPDGKDLCLAVDGQCHIVAVSAISGPEPRVVLPPLTQVHVEAPGYGLVTLLVQEAHGFWPDTDPGS